MIKHVISVLAGIAVGIVAFLGLVYFNPLTSASQLSPLAVSLNQLVVLKYSAVSEQSLAYTNDGESQVAPHPAKILQLWEAPIRHTIVRAVVLSDARNETAGLGIKFCSESESTNILNGQAMVDSAWHVFLPGRGSMFVEQKENYWNYLREVVMPAHWSSGDSWRGNWQGRITAGPNALGLARVVGGSGEFAGLQSVAAESLYARAYSVERGPVALDGELTIEIPAAGGVTPSP